LRSRRRAIGSGERLVGVPPRTTGVGLAAAFELVEGIHHAWIIERGERLDFRPGVEESRTVFNIG